MLGAIGMNKRKVVKRLLIIPIIIILIIVSFIARYIYWTMNPPKIGEPKDEHHTTANDKSLGILDYQDGYLYLLKDNNVIKVRTDGTDKQLLRPFNIPIPFVYGNYLELRVIKDQIFLKGDTWSTSEYMRIDGKLWAPDSSDLYHRLGSVYSDKFIYNNGNEITKYDTETGKITILWKTSGSITNTDYFVLCNEWLFFSYNDKCYKVKTDGSEQAEELQKLAGYQVRFSEGNTVYFSLGSSDAITGTGLIAMNINSGDIETITNDGNILSYADNILLYEESRYCNSVHFYMEYEGRRIDMPDDFKASSYLIKNTKVYYASDIDKDTHIKCVDTDGNITQIV